MPNVVLTPTRSLPPLKTQRRRRHVVRLRVVRDGRLDRPPGSSTSTPSQLRPRCSRGTKVLLSGMAKEKVTLTLDSENLAALRSLVGSRSLSASVDRAIAAHVD